MIEYYFYNNNIIILVYLFIFNFCLSFYWSTLDKQNFANWAVMYTNEFKFCRKDIELLHERI